MEQISVVLTTVPDAAAGARIARCLVEEKLAACVNVVPGLRSFYRWEGKLEEGAEALLIAKIRSERFDEYERRMKEIHPYSVPEIVALPAERVSQAYLLWCLEQA
ncbi:MAG: divalent-cation tolerance protein CutA [Planctomycetes bacterium]|nr:divalent-cation tolerance protein CutA [Planctomycetota bacterium]